MAANEEANPQQEGAAAPGNQSVLPDSVEKLSHELIGFLGAQLHENDETASDWELKVGPSNRNWHATVQEQVPDERIQWTSEGPKGTTHGEVSFHELAPRLTRVVVVVEYNA